MRRDSTTVLVLGGGPAGAASAIELAQVGCDVVLLERNKTPGWKIGETLPPEARVHLQRLKHWETFQQSGHLPCFGIVSCWGSPAPVEVDFMMNPYGHGWQLDRARFEEDLLRAAEDAGCRVFLGTEARSFRRQAGGWRFETSAGDFNAEWVLDCTGRTGILAESGLGGSFDLWQDTVALYCVLESAAGKDRDARTYVESHPSGWCYSALTPNGTRIVAFLTDRDLIPSDTDPAGWMQQRLQEGPEIGRLLSEHAYFPVESVHLVSAASGRYRQIAGSHWMLVGDAGMTFDPLSGWGSAKAIGSAAAAVQATLSGVDFQSSCDELWNQYLVQYRDYYLAERRWPDAPFWSRRHQLVLS